MAVKAKLYSFVQAFLTKTSHTEKQRHFRNHKVTTGKKKLAEGKREISFCLQLPTKETHKKPRSEITVITVVFCAETDLGLIVYHIEGEGKWFRIMYWELMVVMIAYASGWARIMALSLFLH